MLTSSGAKLLDFGLAKAAAGGAAVSSRSATQTALTSEGTLLGTVPYMSPEQVEGKAADARSDIFALGTVLYEMAAGRRAFDGASQARLISAILKEDPVPIVPRSLDRAVSLCLAKDPDDRWQSARDVAHQLRSIAEGPDTAERDASVRAGRRLARIAWIAGAAVVLAALLGSAFLLRPRPEHGAVFTSSILPPENHHFDFDRSPPAVSPDGRRIAFVARAAEGPRRVWVRSFDASSATPLAGTEDARAPFWSPDCRSLGFFAAGKLKTVELSGGAPRTICDAPVGAGGSWGADGTILFVPATGAGIRRVPSTGGVPTAVIDPDPKVEFGFFWPLFLPDGRRFLFRVNALRSMKAQIVEGSLDSRERRELVDSRSNVAFAAASAGSSRGYLLFLKNRVLMAWAFDAERRRFLGEATPVAEQVQFSGASGVGAFSASQNGVLVYSTALKLSRLVWFDREGRRLDTVVPPGTYNHPRLSHDGRRVAYAIEDPQSAFCDIWIHDLTRRVSSRLTSGPGVNIFPVWSPDDGSIVFSSNRGGPHEIYRRALSSDAEDEKILAGGRSKFAMDWSPANGLIALQSWDTGDELSGLDIQLFSPVDGKAKTILSAPYYELCPQFSPDGLWLAYVSEESGVPEVYLRPRSGAGKKLQVSTSGGRFPKWSRDGTEIFYIAADLETLMAVRVAAGPDVGIPRPLLRAKFKVVDIGFPYDVTGDARRFLVNELEEKDTESITVVQNWTAKLK
jgi:Tol biopolymer transport system component